MHLGILLKLVNELFSEAVYPEDWNTNFLKPIFEKGEVVGPDDNQGIAIVSAFSKLYSLILLNRLMK